MLRAHILACFRTCDLLAQMSVGDARYPRHYQHPSSIDLQKSCLRVVHMSSEGPIQNPLDSV